MRPPPLTGLEVIDVSSMIAGPTAAKLLAQMGADVVHVEPPWGDDSRNTTTPFLGREGFMYLASNQGKRGIVLDLRRPEGREVICRLVKSADIFVHNLTADGASKLGLDYEALAALNPRLIYGSISGFGSRGPMAKLPGYDVVLQAMIGQVVVPPESGAPMLGGIVADPVAPLLLAYGITLAVLERERTGHGQKVETSLLQAAVQMHSTALVKPRGDPADYGVKPNAGRGSGDPTTRIVRAKDGFLLVSAWSDRQFARLCDLAGMPDLARDERCQSRFLRAQHYKELAPLFDRVFLTRTVEQWLGALTEAGIPCGAVNLSAGALVDHEQLWANEMLVELPHPTRGAMVEPGVLVRLSESPGRATHSAPRMGEHTDEVLRKAGYTATEIAALRACGAVA